MIHLLLFITGFLWGWLGVKFMKDVDSSGEYGKWYFTLLGILGWPFIILGLIICFSRPVAWVIRRLTGWTISDPAGILKNSYGSITIMAPHTSWLDAFWGKIAMSSSGINHHILSASHLFKKQPLKFLMVYGLKAVPVGSTGRNSIYEVTEYIKQHKTNVVVCPEGHLKKVSKWNPGFLLMSVRGHVPVILTSIDYKNKVLKVFDIVYPEAMDNKTFWAIIREHYSDQKVNAKYPERYETPKN